MRISSARIRGYRTLKDEIDLDLAGGLTLVGPNNAGKTNALKAIRLFFTGYENTLGYSRDVDLSKGQKAQTNIALTFKGDESSDSEFYDSVKKLRELLGLPEASSGEVTIYLTFSNNSNPVYRVFPNSKRPKTGTLNAQYSRYERAFIDSVLDRFKVHYIPSDKGIPQLYSDLVLPFLVKKAFGVVHPHLKQVSEALAEASEKLNKTLSEAGLKDVSCSFNFPSTPDFLSKDIHFDISDPGQTSIFSKGMGIQSTALMAAFEWITQQEIEAGKSVVWLLEEPESYLHPELVNHSNSIISKLREQSQVIITTHALGFVPQNPKALLGVEREDGWTQIKRYKTYREASQRIRQSLGVQFSDFYNLATYNIFVEGETDREMIQEIIDLLKGNEDVEGMPYITSNEVGILDWGGVKSLEGFMRATYEFIRAERPCMVMLDGDEAGDKTRRDLQQFFGNKEIGFEANVNFVSVRRGFAMEGLFPDAWIIEMNAEHPNWFKDFSVDASGQLQPFTLKDDNKRSANQFLLSKARSAGSHEWAEKWLDVLRVLNSGLGQQSKRIYGKAIINAPDRVAETAVTSA